MTHQELYDILFRARSYIEDERNWCKRFYACTTDGDCITPLAPAAVQWCAVGALFKAIPLAASEKFHSVRALLWKASQELYDMDAPKVNDDVGHLAVLKVYDAALAKLVTQMSAIK